jgi:hypothetical protein
LETVKNEVEDSSYLFQTAKNVNIEIHTGLEHAISIYGEDEFVNYRKISGREIMQFYTPRWLALIGLFSSILASAQLPMFGFILSKMIFVLMN